VARAHPGWDPGAFRRRLRALTLGAEKLIQGSDGRQELYDLAADPHETRDRAGDQPQRAAQLAADLDRYVARLAHCTPPSRPHERRQMTAEQQDLLEQLGYLENDARTPETP
jgi:hypothetical protein